MLKVTEELELGNLHEKIASLIPRGYRFVTMTAVDAVDHFDIFYHFDLQFELNTFLLKLPKEQSLPSISNVCFAALLAENEIQDLFGITVTDLVIDYKKSFILAQDAPVKPFCKVPGVGVSVLEKNAEGEKK